MQYVALHCRGHAAKTAVMLVLWQESFATLQNNLFKSVCAVCWL
jgi:hypothetical protein